MFRIPRTGNGLPIQTIYILRNMLYRIVYILLYLVSLLPLWSLYILSYLAFLVAYYVAGYRKKVVRQNIANSFPEMTEEERKKTVRKFYRLFCDRFAEILKLMSISPGRLAKRLEVHNSELYDKYYNENRHVILAVGHIGNWEMSNLMPRYMKQQMFAVYRPLHNKTFDRLMKDIRSRFNLNMIADKQVARHMLTPREEPYVYYILGDQCPFNVIEKYRIPFLNQPTAMYNGIEKLAQSTNAAVVYLSILPGKRRGHYIMELSLITDTPKETGETEITRMYAARLEENIRQAPHTWLWSHKRWKR